MVVGLFAMAKLTLKNILNHISKGRDIELKCDHEVEILGKSNKGHPFHVTLEYDYLNKVGISEMDKGAYLIEGPLLPVQKLIVCSGGLRKPMKITGYEAAQIIQPHFLTTARDDDFSLGLATFGFYFETSKGNFDLHSSLDERCVFRDITPKMGSHQHDSVSNSYFFG